MINKYKVTTAFTIESREMTHVGGNTKQVKVADRSLEVLLDSLQKEGVDVDRDNSQKKISFPVKGQYKELVVPVGVLYGKETIKGYELQATELQILVSEYDHSHSLSPGIGGQVNYIFGIEVKLEYTVNTLVGVEEKCTKIEEVFKGLYDPIVRARNERLAAMTPEARQRFEEEGKRLGEALMRGGKKGEESVDAGQKVADVQLLKGSPAGEPVYKFGFEKKSKE